MNWILLVLIFGSAIAAGKAKKCMTCRETGNEINNCSGDEQECENEDDLCSSQMEVNKVGEDSRSAVSKRCISADQKDLACKNLWTENSIALKILIYTKCCEEADCTPDGITMPEEDLTENGHECNACFEEGSTECTKYSIVKCTGNQEQCFKYVGTGSRPDGEPQKYAVEGCITYRGCEYQLYNVAGSQIDPNDSFTCE